MTLVQIIKSWAGMDLLRQTPGGQGYWEDIRFTEEPVSRSDYVVVLNRASEDTTVYCPPHHVWALIQEPPNEVSGWLHFGDPSFARVYTNDERIQGQKFFHSQPATPWKVNKDYDFLARCPSPEKNRVLSWITSNNVVVRGHRLRMKFLASINGKIDLDLYGHGFHDIEDKWDGLVDYRYSLAIENYSNPIYWSEKLADCFLAWTMPIYYGCRNITEYFPEESLVQIDITKPDSFEKVKEAIRSDAWRRHRDAVAYARDLVLNRYQLFPFLTGEIKSHQEKNDKFDHSHHAIHIPSQPRGPLNPKEKARKFWRRIVPRKLRKYLFNHLPNLERFR